DPIPIEEAALLAANHPRDDPILLIAGNSLLDDAQVQAPHIPIRETISQNQEVLLSHHFAYDSRHHPDACVLLDVADVVVVGNDDAVRPLLPAGRMKIAVDLIQDHDRLRTLSEHRQLPRRNAFYAFAETRI